MMNLKNAIGKSMPSRVLLISLLIISTLNLHAQKAAFSDTTLLFEPDRDGYTMYHVPALLISKKGTVLAFAEGRFGDGRDWVDMDLVMRRSIDNGKTWEPLTIIIPHTKGEPTSNITPIADENGTIHLLFHINYAKAYYMKSLDEGKNWSKPQEITYAFDLFKKEYDWKVLAPGPGHAIQLNNGRLLVPVWLCIPNKSMPGGDHRPSCVATIYSDDHGKSWKRGEIISDNKDISAVSKDTIINPNESVAIQLADGRVMMNMRNETRINRRLISYSPDGISGWSIPEFDKELFEPICMASLIRITGKGQDRNRILFVNPDSRNSPVRTYKDRKFYPRENITAKLSYDEGKTWPVQKVLYKDGAGYSDLAVNDEGNIYSLYEVRIGADFSWKYKVVIHRFNVEWLTDGKDFIKHK